MSNFPVVMMLFAVLIGLGVVNTSCRRIAAAIADTNLLLKALVEKKSPRGHRRRPATLIACPIEPP